MKIWLSKNSEIPVREQIIAQITIGIASGELADGTRLPSTREIAQRYKIHANTVSNAYQLLAEQGYIEFRKGSGFYVRDRHPRADANSLDRLVAQFVETALGLGCRPAEIRKGLNDYFERRPAERILVVETDEGLRGILLAEIGAATGTEVGGASFAEWRETMRESDAVCAAMFDEKARISAHLPPGKTCIFLQMRSASASMKGEPRPPENQLIAVVSGWPNFLTLAKTMLVAVEIEPESLLLRSTAENNWRKGLSAASMIICDSLTATRMPGDPRVRPFPLIAETSLDELRRSLLPAA